MDHRHLYTGLIRLHILHHATQEKVYGLELIEELGRHGYKMSAGTLYPLLHGLEDRGLLVADIEKAGRSRRRVYTATPAGHTAMAAARQKVRELFSELFEHPDEPLPTPARHRAPAAPPKQNGPKPPGRRRPAAKSI